MRSRGRADTARMLGEALMISPSGTLTPQRLNRIITDLLNHRYIGVLSAHDQTASAEVARIAGTERT